MSRADFTLTYDGPALQDHEMDARELAPAMLAVGELFDAMNILLNGEAAEVTVSSAVMVRRDMEACSIKASGPPAQPVEFRGMTSWIAGYVPHLIKSAVANTCLRATPRRMDPPPRSL